MAMFYFVKRLSAFRIITETRTYRNYYHGLTKRLDIPRLKYHGLRHSFATRCIESNCDHKTVSVLLGHANITTTLNLYVHPNMEQVKDLSEYANYKGIEIRKIFEELIDCGINLYIQKEQLTLLDEEGHPSLFAPIIIATLSTCAQLERVNISFRLQSGRKRYIEKGGPLSPLLSNIVLNELDKELERVVIRSYVTQMTA